MFVAIIKNGEKQLAFHEDKERLYSLAKAKQLYCPLSIEVSFLEWFHQAYLKQSIQLEENEINFINHLNNLVKENAFISQGVYDTFFP